MKKISSFKIILVTSLLTVNTYAHSEELVSISEKYINSLSTNFKVSSVTVNDYVSSYDFKCPKILQKEQLRYLLNDEFSDNELNIMLESERMGWRDTYLDARSDITCLD